MLTRSRRDVMLGNVALQTLLKRRKKKLKLVVDMENVTWYDIRVAAGTIAAE